jgi:uncharacterized protein DUF1706
MDKQALLAEMRAGRARLEAVLTDMTDDQMAEPVNGDWTRTDILAHIEAWERRTNRLLAILRGEREFDADEPGDVDAFNAWSFERNRGRGLAEVRASEADAWREIVALVESADEAELTDSTRFEFLAGTPFTRTVLENTSEHYTDHLDQLEA